MVAVDVNPRLEAALLYAALLWPVVPLHTPVDGVCDCPKRDKCESPGKHPRTMHGLDDATTDADKIHRWWSIWPHANIAIDLSAAVLVDIAPDSVEWYAEFVARGLPPTLRFASGAGDGHEHWLYERPIECPTYRLTKSGQYDILSDGYAVMPPSLHVSGRTYTWLEPSTGLPIASPGKAAPEWAVAMLQERTKKAASTGTSSVSFDADEPPVRLSDEDLDIWHGRSVIQKPDGNIDRSDSLWRIARVLTNNGASPHVVAAALAERDMTLGWRCYTDRSDAATQYWNAATKEGPVTQPKRVRLKPDEVDTPAVREFIITNLGTVMPERVDWLWQHKVALGKLTLLDGDPDLGKSLITLDLAARLSRGKAMPDGSHAFEGPAGTVLLSAEDGIADTIRPRLEAAGGDPDRIVALEGIVARKGSLPAMPSLEDLDAIEAAVHLVDAKLIVVDPIMAYLPTGVSAFKDQEVRRLLGPLVMLISRLNVALICVRHLNKDTNKPSLYRGGGTIGFAGAARSVMLVGKNPEDATQRILARQKGNLAPPWKSMVYELVAEFEAEQPHIRWHKETSNLTADDLLRVRVPDSPETASLLSEAVDFLKQTLADGQRQAMEVMAEAKKLNISQRTLERAKAFLEIRSLRLIVGDQAHWYWALAKSATQGSHGNVGGVDGLGGVGGENDDE